MQVVLISTYDLGHQPFGLASPARWLKHAGADVACLDLAVQPLAEAVSTISEAELIAFYLPMHTATKLAMEVIPRVKRLNRNAHLSAYGLYATVNEDHLRELGVHSIIGGEFEQPLVDLFCGLLQGERIETPSVSLARQQFLTPDRAGLPPLNKYARLRASEEESRLVGYVQASRGCKHTCRHCPIVPVYDGRFRIVGRDVVLSDIRQQVAAGARHITFGDPDFFNGPGHAIPLVEALHSEFPELTYDVTIKVEHLLKHQRHLPLLRDTGCLFVTSAVESNDAHVLEVFDKRHGWADFEKVVALFREVGLALNPTFVSFTPWTTPRGYVELLASIDNLGLIDHVAPIQYGIRLLIPAGSKLLELSDVKELVGPFDDGALVYPWKYADPRMEALYETVYGLIRANQAAGASRRIHFERIWQAAVALLEGEAYPVRFGQYKEAFVPTISEDWY
jgi:radical SAM superfamily enzyme YgiQ (UPF0313 family)